MHTHSLHRWQHDHIFGQDQTKAGERRTLFVIALTVATMIIEVIAGIGFGSMALLADGLHMASHATALSITAVAYWYARKRAHDQRFGRFVPLDPPPQRLVPTGRSKAPNVRFTP